MARSTRTQKSERINAAHQLLVRGLPVAEAADLLSRDFAISPRQAYRYVEEAQAIRRPLPIAEPSVPITFKIPGDVIRQLRAYSSASGMTLSEIVTRALKAFLTAATRRHG
jgi:predicted DNA-binding transcriptional regulator YafY